MRCPVPGRYSPGQISRYCGLIILLVFGGGLQAAGPGRPDTFDWVDLQKQNNKLIMTIHFRYPVMYQWHFPQSEGDTLLVQLKPIPLHTRPGVSEQRSYKPLEIALVPPNEYIDSVSFEYNDAWNGLLNVQFSRTVPYRVYPTDLRKLVLEIDTTNTTDNKTNKNLKP